MRNEPNIRKAGNAAPLQPILDLKDPSKKDKDVQDHYLVKELRRKYEELIKKDQTSWREMVCAGQIIAHFIQGDQILRINSFNGMPKIERADLKDPQHIKAINKMRFYATTWQDKWRSSKPDILLSPLSNTDEAIAQVKKANTVVDYLESKFFDTWFDLQEGLSAQIWGWYGRRVSPDFTAKSFHIFRDIWGEKEVKVGRAYGKCEKCGYKGDGVKEDKINKKVFNLCPKCGDMEYEYSPAVTQMMPYKKDREKVFLPEIVCEPLHFPAVRFDIGKRAEDSSWFITERKIEESHLRRIFSDIRFPEGESGNEFGLDVIETLAQRGTALSGSSDVAESKSEKVTLTEMYLSSDDLYDIRIGGDEKTVEGKTLPKGKRLSDVFPDGCVVVGINGMSLIVGIYSDCHKHSITSGVYHMKPMSGTGQGVGDAVEVQKQFNRRYSQIDAMHASQGTPGWLTPENAIEPQYKRLIGNPKAIIPIKLQNFPEIRDVGQLLRPIQGGTVPGDLLNTTFNNLEQMMQTTYHITNFGGASPQGVNNHTATYAQINDANSDAIFSPVLAVKADVTVKTVKKGFNLWVKYTPEARFLPFKSKDSFGIEISGKDVDAEYNWSYVPGSEAPKNRYTETQKRIGFFSMFAGGMAEYFAIKKQFPQEIAEIERDFDVNFESANYDNVGETCRLRFNRAKTEMKKGKNPLEILANLEPTLLPTEPNLIEKSTWFAELLDTAEGLEMSAEERELVSAFVLAFKELDKGKTIHLQRDAAEIQIASQAPFQREAAAQQMVQQGIAQEQKADEQAVQSEQQDKQLAAGVLQTLAQNAESESARESEERIAQGENAVRAAEMMNEQVLAENQNA